MLKETTDWIEQRIMSCYDISHKTMKKYPNDHWKIGFCTAKLEEIGSLSIILEKEGIEESEIMKNFYKRIRQDAEKEDIEDQKQLDKINKK